MTPHCVSCTCQYAWEIVSYHTMHIVEIASGVVLGGLLLSWLLT